MTMTVFEPTDRPATSLAVVFHGRNGSGDAPHMVRLLRPYLRRGYRVVAPNLCGSDWNDSAGTGSDFTISMQVRDGRRALRWALEHAARARWQIDRMALAGHSMGGYVASQLAIGDLGGRLDHLMLVSTFTSGARQIEARRALAPDALEVLARELPKAATEWPRHDILPQAARFTFPTAILSGAKDRIVPARNCKELFDLLPRGVCYIVMPEADHCMEGKTSEGFIAGALDVLEATVATVATS
ncbi:alpha/beta fold hydrolase [Hartmannibacter diazotrophicus]|nr:alpha/beta fold hydrolase [Hartmannibacter diazotrophicus]